MPLLDQAIREKFKTQYFQFKKKNRLPHGKAANSNCDNLLWETHIIFLNSFDSLKRMLRGESSTHLPLTPVARRLLRAGDEETEQVPAQVKF
jgi:hypothetical protein